MLSTLIDPWLLYPLITALKGIKYPLRWPRWNNILGVMIKTQGRYLGWRVPGRQYQQTADRE